VKVVVAHNRYREAIPSGENVIVDTEIAQLRAAGVEVLPFQRSSDSIGELPAVQKALLPLSPIYGRAAQQDLSRLLAPALDLRVRQAGIDMTKTDERIATCLKERPASTWPPARGSGLE